MTEATSSDPVRFRLARRREGRTVVLAPQGDLDQISCPNLRAALLQRQRTRFPTVLNLKKVTFMDSTALVMLIAARARARAAGWPLEIVDPSAAVDRVLRETGTLSVVLAG